MITKDDWERLWEIRTDDPTKVFITDERFKVLYSVMTVWRPDLMQEFVAWMDEFETLSKSDLPAIIYHARILGLMEKYSDVITEISKEVELRKEDIGLLQKKDLNYSTGIKRNHTILTLS